MLIDTIKKIEITNWKEFNIKSLFDIDKIKKETTKEDLDENEVGDFPYITNTSKNNGINGFYKNYTEEGNCITICSLGSFFIKSILF